MVFVLLGSQPMFAQTNRDGRLRAAFSAGVQADTAGLSQSFTLIKNSESAPIAADLSPAAVPSFDAAVTYMLVNRIGVGAAVSLTNARSDAEITARIPHVFFFNQLRPISGAARVRHEELATHLSGIYVLPFGRVELALAAGASLFSVKKDFVSDVDYEESYPYDTASFAQARLTREQVSKAGYHAGADVTWRITRNWGAGALVRYSRARAPFSIGTLDVGGLQTGAGIRARF